MRDHGAQDIMSTRWTEADLRAFTQRRLKHEERTRAKIRNENNTSVGAISNPERQRDTAPALDRGAQTITSRRRSVAIRVSITSVRKRLLDNDNLIAGSKWLRDQIAETLGLDDAEGSGLTFEYSQVLTQGTEGTVVRIEQI